MPMLPDAGHMDIIESACLLAHDRGTPRSAFELAQLIMDEPELPMHCPYHHYLIPAVLLTAAGISQGSDRESLKKQLLTARERAGAIPGGYCGQFGCCGAAMGAGIFYCIMTKMTPLAKKGWAAGNEITARCLSAIASVEGPRCCKRVTYLTLMEAAAAAKELLGLDLGEMPRFSCHHHSRSRDCKKDECPFFPKMEQKTEL